MKKVNLEQISRAILNRSNALLIFTLLLLHGCTVGPNYVRPIANVPVKYKEAPKAASGWKIAQPQDEGDRGEWWKIFRNPELDALMAYVNISNQNIAAAEAQYRQARAQIDVARAGYYPIVNGSAGVVRQKTPHGLSGTDTSQTNIISDTFNTYTLLLSATWEPDIWGSVRRLVESRKASAQASAAQLAAVRLSTQAMLAQLYFQLRTLDRDQLILNQTAKAYQQLYQLTKNRFKAGIISLADVAQAQAQYNAAQAQAIDNGVNRAHFEHAIAVLIGQPPANLSLAPKVLILRPPHIPVEVPSALLERRPDIAQAERQVAAANASIGVAIAAYFPTLGLSSTVGYQSNKLSRLISKPAFLWSVGAQLAETLFDGGLRGANVRIARGAYEQTVAVYRQTVLSAFQNVEDNLSSLRILKEEAAIQDQAVAAAKLALRLTLRNYKAGTASLSDVLIAETTAHTTEKNASDIAGRRMAAAVGLITALGGSWDTEQLQQLTNAELTWRPTSRNIVRLFDGDINHS